MIHVFKEFFSLIHFQFNINLLAQTIIVFLRNVKIENVSYNFFSFEEKIMHHFKETCIKFLFQPFASKALICLQRLHFLLIHHELIIWEHFTEYTVYMRLYMTNRSVTCVAVCPAVRFPLAVEYPVFFSGRLGDVGENRVTLETILPSV